MAGSYRKEEFYRQYGGVIIKTCYKYIYKIEGE